MSQAIFVRHQTTSWNREWRIQGHTDIPLDDGGRADAHKLRDRMNHLIIDRVVSSDLKRARETAEILTLGRGLSIKFDKRFRECGFGRGEGMTRDELGKMYGKEFSDRFGDVHAYDFSICGGETRDQVLQRQRDLLREIIAETPPHHAILFVGHGRSISTLLYEIGDRVMISKVDYHIVEGERLRQFLKLR